MFVWTISDVVGLSVWGIIVLVVVGAWLWDKFKIAMNRMFGEGK